jgi:hypothetical protein
MLNYDTAVKIVKRSIQHSGGNDTTSDSQSLADLGLVDDEAIQRLILQIGERVQGHQQKIDPVRLSGLLQSSLSVDQVTKHVMHLAGGKLCSNPNPHEQTCCPYPAKCPQCGWPVPPD